MRQGLQFTNQSITKEAEPRIEKRVPEITHARTNACSASISSLFTVTIKPNFTKTPSQVEAGLVLKTLYLQKEVKCEGVKNLKGERGEQKEWGRQSKVILSNPNLYLYFDLPHRLAERKIRETLQSPLSLLNLTVGIVNSGPDIEISMVAKDTLKIDRKPWREVELAKTTTANGCCSKGKWENYGASLCVDVGSHMTAVNKLKAAHSESDPRISLLKDVMVLQFMMELQGLKMVEDEDTPTILHFNRRLKGN
ncbi:galactosyltransferase family protein [Striga asiatica]|uniref:Galactosyltransferase family protein n=1 Tax=Striga asiatica TaxID=4170 RepID=A0A5A7Q9Y9_STRAF|nr:galactosyltransferase family protein [Striga asiatica]